MSESFVAEFSELQPSPSAPPHDLLARLYREIGLSAVAAALEVMDRPDNAKRAHPSDEARLPEFLQSEDLAA